MGIKLGAIGGLALHKHVLQPRAPRKLSIVGEAEPAFFLKILPEPKFEGGSVGDSGFYSFPLQYSTIPRLHRITIS